MKLTTPLAAGLVMANTIASSPAVKRNNELLLSQKSPSNATVGQQGSHEWSQNWAGAVLGGSDFQTVAGTFVVPELVLPAGARPERYYAASAWVGIDGWRGECKGVLMQTGLIFWIQDNKYDSRAWYQWYPNKNVQIYHMEFSPGDSVTLTLTASSETGGIAIIDNNTKGTSVNHTFVNVSPRLCRTTAEWIFEDFRDPQGQVPFANFGNVTFTNAFAVNSNGTRFGPADANLLDMIDQSGSDWSVLTDVAVDDSSVSVVYEKRP